MDGLRYGLRYEFERIQKNPERAVEEAVIQFDIGE
jgi:hypothetical protein